MTEQVDSTEYLEEILLQGLQEFLPRLQRYVERFVDIFNDKKAQIEMKHIRDDYEDYILSHLQKMRDAEHVFDMFHELKLIMVRIKSTFNPVTIVENLLKTGFYSLLSDKEYEFLRDNDMEHEKRVDSFIEFLCQQTNDDEARSFEVTEKKNAFERYIKEWQVFQTNRRFSEDDINQELIGIREKFAAAKSLGDRAIDEIIFDIQERFQPLKSKLIWGNAANTTKNAAIVASPIIAVAPIIAFIPVVGIALAPIALATTSIIGALKHRYDATHDNYHERRKLDGWFENTSDYLIKYLVTEINSSEMCLFIEYEHLEEDLKYFKEYFGPWITDFENKIKDISRHESIRLPKNAILLELNRLHKFVCAVLLNKPALLKEHSELLVDVIKKATENIAGSGVCLLPCISFGQLPIEGGQVQRCIDVAFVLDSSLDEQKVKNVMNSLKEILGESYINAEIEHNENLAKNIVNMKIKIKDNVAFMLARNIGKLADLSVRSVMVGSLGFDKQKYDKQPFRHAMYPAYNRIYSIDGVDRATGFEPTYFRHPFDRAGEPYYCPNGWRRFAIDVGMTGSEFTKAYSDWHIAYHGTSGDLAMQILVTGLLASGFGCYLDSYKERGAVYLSPSIEYAAHDCYAKVWETNGKYIQMVLQCRVNKWRVSGIHGGTLNGAFSDDPQPADPNFSNDELEWVIAQRPNSLITSEDILVYGLMLRITDVHPKCLPQNKWWGET